MNLDVLRFRVLIKKPHEAFQEHPHMEERRGKGGSWVTRESVRKCVISNTDFYAFYNIKYPMY